MPLSHRTNRNGPVPTGLRPGPGSPARPDEAGARGGWGPSRGRGPGLPARGNGRERSARRGRHLFHPLELIRPGAEGGVHDSPVGKEHVLRRERSAVMPTHALAEMKSEHLSPLREFPGRGQTWHRLEVRSLVHQRVGDELGHQEAPGVAASQEVEEGGSELMGMTTRSPSTGAEASGADARWVGFSRQSTSGRISASTRAARAVRSTKTPGPPLIGD